MSDLNFKITVVPKDPVNLKERDHLLSKIKSTLIICNLEDVSASYSQVRKSDNEDYPELEELSLQVHAKAGGAYHRQKVQQYREFCLRWKTQFFTLPCSYVVLYENDCFVRTKQTHHRETYEKLAFGVLPHNGLFYEYFSMTESNNFVDFYHDTRNVVIHYDTYEMTFTYDNIKNIFINIRNRPWEVYFDLFNPPLIFRVQTMIQKDGNHYKVRHRNLNFGTTLRIDTDIIGRASVLSFNFCSRTGIDKIISGIHYHCSEKPVLYGCISSFQKVKPLDPVIANMHFGCAYLITAIFKRNFVAVVQTDDINRSLDKLNFLSTQDPSCLEKALVSVLIALDTGKILKVWHAIENQYHYYTANKNEINFKEYILPPKCCMIRSVTLTPTRQLLWPKEIVFGNRILRNFDPEYSLRVSFRDDNLCNLSFNALLADEGVLDTSIKNPMTTGIRIGSRHYDFLAWSNSQIRDHGVYTYARDSNGRNAEYIRQWMGDFSHIHSVSKYMARMGQCFSHTEEALSVPLDPEHVRTEDDIEGGCSPGSRKPYCFTDGVGKISSELASKVSKKTIFYE